MTKVYIVERRGVYQQGCGGVFSTPEKAIESANKNKADETDDYHDFNVIEIELDKIYYCDRYTETLPKFEDNRVTLTIKGDS